MLVSFAMCAPYGRHRGGVSTMLGLAGLVLVSGLRGRGAVEQGRLCCLVPVLRWSPRV